MSDESVVPAKCSLSLTFTGAEVRPRGNGARGQLFDGAAFERIDL